MAISRRCGLPFGLLPPRRSYVRGGPLAALLHFRNDGEAQTRAALAPELPGRAPFDDVLARPAARRPPLEYQFPGMGQTRLELLFRPLECRRHGIRIQPVTFPRARRPGSAGEIRRHDAVCATYRVAVVGAGTAG